MGRSYIQYLTVLVLLLEYQDATSNQESFFKRVCQLKLAQRISCPPGASINVTNAMYGRLENGICSRMSYLNPNCTSSNSFEVTSEKCNGRTTCNLLASNHWFGNPCEGVLKYLDVWYQCLKAMCQADSARGNKTSVDFNWTSTFADETAKQLCPGSKVRFAKRACIGNYSGTVWWGPVRDNACLVPLDERTHRLMCQANSAAGNKTSVVFKWTATFAGETARLQCPKRQNMFAERSCILKHLGTASWGPVRDIACRVPRDIKIMQTICKADFAAGRKTSTIFNWTDTSGGTTTRQLCPETQNKFAKRACICTSLGDASWGPVRDDACPMLQNKRATEFKKMANAAVESGKAKEISETLANLTGDNPSGMNATELTHVTKIMTKLTKVFHAANKTQNNQVADLLLTTIDNYLYANQSIVKQAQKEYNTSSLMLSIISELAVDLIQSESNKSSIMIAKNNFDIAVTQEKTPFMGIIMSYSTGPNSGKMTMLHGSISTTIHKNYIYLPKKVARQGRSSADSSTFKIAFVRYKTGKFFNTNGLSSEILSAEIIGERIDNLQSPVVINLNISKEYRNKVALCSFWDLSKSGGKGDWSSEGCRLHKIKAAIVTCHCDHLTNFAVILGAKTPITLEHTQALSIISYVGCAISLAGTMATLITYIIFPRLRDRHPPKILMNLVTAYILLLLTYVIGVTRTETRAGCKAASAILQYFLLCVFSWSAVEGFNSFRGIVQPMAEQIRKFMWKAMAIAWGTPILFVLIGMSIWPDNYGNNESCVVRDLPFYITLLCPIIVILILNFGVLIWIMKRLSKSSQMYSHNEMSGGERLRIIAAFVLLFGLTWVFGFLVVSNDILAFQYIFCILNSFQGFFIFLFYCVRNPNARKAWADKFGIKKLSLTSTSTSNVSASRKTESGPFESPTDNSSESLMSSNTELKL